MAFDRPSRTLGVFVCDACGDTFEVSRSPGEFNFKECWAEAHDEGWRIKSGEHYCPDCAELD